MIDPIQPEYDEKVERDLTPEELVAALLRTIAMNVNPWAQSSSVERVANEYTRQLIHGVERRLIYDWSQFKAEPNYDVIRLGIDWAQPATDETVVMTIAGIEFTKYARPIPPVNPELPERTDDADENQES